MPPSADAEVAVAALPSPVDDDVPADVLLLVFAAGEVPPLLDAVPELEHAVSASAPAASDTAATLIDRFTDVLSFSRPWPVQLVAPTVMNHHHGTPNQL
ncbi:MAG: hypothetical protein ACTHMS_09790 [Jatrophihabitans sp.]|uniref:hypothetical protein n=1 Tax=Jatrophihabitans sp. TaxID=1932789 RepID=UPI003F7D585E